MKIIDTLHGLHRRFPPAFSFSSTDSLCVSAATCYLIYAWLHVTISSYNNICDYKFTHHHENLLLGKLYGKLKLLRPLNIAVAMNILHIYRLSHCKSTKIIQNEACEFQAFILFKGKYCLAKWNFEFRSVVSSLMDPLMEY